jgi:hypothetical protein
MCQAKGCTRPTFQDGLCGFHLLQGYYRATATAGGGLSASRIVQGPKGEPPRAPTERPSSD